MKYPNIEALVPAGEHCDMEAMNEGIWLTQSHVNSIEASLAGSATATAALNEQITGLNDQLSEAQASLQTANENLANAQASLGTKDAEIEKLNEQIAELKKGAAGSFSSTTNDEDGGNAPDPKQKYMNSPVTQAALKYSK